MKTTHTGDHTTPQKSHLAPLFELVRSEYRELGIILTYQIGIGILTLTIPVGVQAIVNNLAFTQLFQPVLFLAIALLLCQVVAGIFRLSQMLVVEKVQRRIFSHLGMELAYRLPRMEKSGARFPEVVNRFFDVVTVQKSVSMLAIEGFGLLLQMVIGLILLAFYHPFLLVFDIGLILALAVIVFFVGQGALNKTIEESRWKYKVVEWLEEIAAKSVAFSSRSARFLALQRADEILHSYLEARKEAFGVVFRQMIGFLALQAVANVALLTLGVWLVISNQLSIGQLVAAELVVSGVLYSFTRFHKHLAAYYDLIAALDKIKTLFSFPIEHDGQGLPHGQTTGMEIQVSDVTYQPYESNATLGPFSLSLPQGARCAIQGANGSGKSTLIDLIYAVKQPAAGSIVINGIDSRMLSPQILRERIALVRGTEIVHGSILKNVRVGNPAATVEQVSDVLRRVGLFEAVLDLPEGLSTTISHDGVPLSVGQVKLLLLARALVADPDVLLIDQALDTLDAQSRNTAISLIFAPTARWSVLIATQDADVMCHCQTVINLDRTFPSQEAH